MIADEQIKLIVGSLLHDIGKVVYRSGDGRNHSQSGYDYLKTEIAMEDESILNCVRYHHGAYLKRAQIADDALAYVVYYADNVAAFTDRREAEEKEDGFDRSVPLASVFNILNDNHGKSHYAMQVLDPKGEINFPTEETVRMDEHFYQTVVRNISDNLKGMEMNEEYINSLLSVLEANLTYIPSSTSKRELIDISLYDHVKMTAAIASCVEHYLRENGEDDYRTKLFVNAEKSYGEEMFLLYSMDVSGIQNFIYTVAEKGALRGLRARSFYLEIMMEHIVDELLERLSLSRANLIYTGGGHCYILMPNTEDVKKTLRVYEQELNDWMLENFDISLYVACGYAKASANALRNVPQGSYSKLYQQISRMISGKKSHRYDAKAIQKLNNRVHEGERECKVCRKIARLIDDKCELCTAIEKMSANVLYKKYFAVMCEMEEGALPLSMNRYLVACDKANLLSRMEKDTYVRCYTKNDIYTGKHVTTKLWVGDYTTGETFEELAESSKGVDRLGVLRADVDNLGMTFVSGFQRKDGDDKYVTISRTAALSRQLSLFFKCYINGILTEGNDGVLSDNVKRKVAIVYSGGDDIFLVGAWNDVLASFADIRNAFERFTQGTITLSGGVGIYHAKYPLNVMAKEVADLEECAKSVDGKNAISIFSDEHVYKWSTFSEKVLSEKYVAIDAYLSKTEERGMAFIYHLVELLRDEGEKINFARYVYLLSRMEPTGEENVTERERYRAFSKKMYEWSKAKEDRKELITAIYLYVYLNRKEEEM